MMRNFRPALPALILLLSAAGLGVSASSAQSKSTAKKKPAASNAKPASPKASAAKTTAKGPATKKASGTAPKTSARTGKRTNSRSRRQPGQKAPMSDRVIEIQSALAKDGSFNGMADGKWSDETTAAMRKFQASHGLNPTGRLDALTLQKLGLGSQTAGVAAPKPPPGSVSRLTSSAIVPTSPTETARRQ